VLRRIELHELGGAKMVRIWAPAGTATLDAHDLFTARYPLGDAGETRAEIAYFWAGESEDVSLDLDVLLQLLADHVELRLSQLASPLASVRPAARMPPSASSDVGAPALAGRE
jgi:hypothetical protein